MFKRRIYLDYAALTPIDPRVLSEMKKFSAPAYANPSSLYREGVAAKKAIAEARKTVADFIHAHPDEIVFTSGGTEANGLALEGCGRAAHRSGIQKPHLIISAIEHSSIIETAKMLEQHGVEVTRLSVDKFGIISLEELKRSIKPNTFLVSIMTVNNEIGSIQPIREIAKIIRHSRGRTLRSDLTGIYPLFHTDAAQAVLFHDQHVDQLGVDLITLDGSKMYGPRGIGCLYVKRNTPIEQIMYGGGQERGLRSGTENVPAIRGFARAVEIVRKEHFSQLKRGDSDTKGGKKKNSQEKFTEFRQMMIEGLKKIQPDIIVNGSDRFSHVFPDTSRNTNFQAKLTHSPHILSVSIPGIDNEFFIFQLDAKGIACSTKSSCLRDEDESYVLKAIGADSKTSIRFSFGRWTTEGEIRRTLKIIQDILG